MADDLSQHDDFHDAPDVGFSADDVVLYRIVISIESAAGATAAAAIPGPHAADRA
jgi:hypothetical protein